MITILYYTALGVGALVCLALVAAVAVVLVGIVASAAAAAAVDRSENGSCD